MDIIENCSYSDINLPAEKDLKAGDSESSIKFSSCNSLCVLASTIGKLACQLQSSPESLEDFFDKLKNLEEEWHNTQMKYQNLLKEHERTLCLLETEKTKASVLNKRMKFIKDNQKNFDTLRKAYISMKESESNTGRTLSLDDKVSQTEGSLIRSSTTDIDDIHKAQKTLSQIKTLVEKREESWSMSKIRDKELQNELNSLRNENQLLQTLLDAKDVQIKSMCSCQDLKERKNRESEDLKKIILKLHTKLRIYETTPSRNTTSNLTEQEKTMLQIIVNSFKKPSDNSEGETVPSLFPEQKKSGSTMRSKSPKIDIRIKRGTKSQEEVNRVRSSKQLNVVKKDSGTAVGPKFQKPEIKPKSSSQEIEMLSGKLKQITQHKICIRPKESHKMTATNATIN